MTHAEEHLMHEALDHEFHKMLDREITREPEEFDDKTKELIAKVLKPRSILKLGRYR
jgi:hypothetical protein